MRQKTWTPESLATKVCKRGHIGDWAIRENKSQVVSAVCRSCVAISVKRHRDAKAIEGRVPTVGQLAKLEQHVEKLEQALALAKERLEVTRELVRLSKRIKELGE